MSISTFNLDEELKKIKQTANPKKLGMILVHNGIVRATSKKENKPVSSLNISYNKEKLQQLIDKTYKENPGIEKIIVKINDGKLNVGDDIMFVIVAGDRRSNILKPFEDLIETIKTKIVEEKETIA